MKISITENSKTIAGILFHSLELLCARVVKFSVTIPAALAILFLTNVASADFTGKVVSISDGDTISVMHSGIPERIRLVGIDCPEKNQAFGERAKKETSNLVYGKTVQVTAFSTDKYGRTIGEVLFENTQSLNKLLVSSGYCWWYEKYAPKNAELKHLQQHARAKKLGLWQDKNQIPLWEFRARARTAPSGIGQKINPANKNSRNYSKQDSQIIGNIKSHIYHRPDCPDYNKVSSKNRIYFNTKLEAENAGFRIARNCQ